MKTKQGTSAWAVGEFAGTFLLVFFGCGSVCAAVTTGVQVSLFEVAMVWGLGIATAIYLTAALSGAHLNPAVTLSLAAWAGFPRRFIPGYILAQLLGSMAAAILLYLIFGGAIAEFEARNHIVRGEAGSEASAMVFAEYYPNPGGHALREADPTRVPLWRAVVAEVVGTAILLLVILCTTDENNRDRPQLLTAATIGLTVTLLISLLGPLTMACFNPARDFGPRIMSSLLGWGTVPFTANGSGWLTVYILSPLVGGWLGGGIYRGVFREAYRRQKHRIAE